ncbi:MAG: hypothetical protein ACP5JW_07865 [Candidatus Bathyarchaeia archaeon]
MRLLRNVRGLSVVVTTLMILVVSVLLATIVTFYAINVVTTRVQEESLHLSKNMFGTIPPGDVLKQP